MRGPLSFFFYLPILVLLVWTVGIVQLQSSDFILYGKYYIAGNIIAICVLFYMGIMRSQLVTPADKNFEIGYSVGVAIFIIAALATLYLIKFISLIPYYGADLARFELRKSPGFGFISRILYWAPIVILPMVVFQRNSHIYITVLLAISLITGSKGAFAWALLSLIGRNILINKSVFSFKNILLIGLPSFFVIILVFYFFSIGSGEVDNIFETFLYRLGFGAVEGLRFVEEYFSDRGASFPFFTIDRTIKSLLSTFRIVPTDGMGDTGVFIANYFNRENDLAGYTLSAAGFGLLEFGPIGALLLPIFSVIVYSILINLISAISFEFSAIFLPCLAVVFCHWLDWGFFDGFINFCVIYVFFIYVFVVLVSYVWGEIQFKFLAKS
jgi:hypothetical protein